MTSPKRSWPTPGPGWTSLYSRPSSLGPYAAESLTTKVRSVRVLFGWLFQGDYVPFHHLAKLQKPVVGYRHPKALSDGRWSSCSPRASYSRSTTRRLSAPASQRVRRFDTVPMRPRRRFHHRAQ